MKALDLMKALRDVPDDLIDECFDEPDPRINAQTMPVDLFAEYASKVAAKPVQAPQKTAESPHLLKYVAVAASLLFAVGFGALILRSSMWNQPVQNDAPDTEPVYTELELHANELPVLSEDEINEPVKEGKLRYAQNGFRPALIDTEKYIGEYFSEDSEGDLNSLEAKSYLYHMMLNSMDYYQTAEGEMMIGLPDSGSTSVHIEFQLDNINLCSYEKREYLNAAMHDKEMYFAELTEYELDTENNSYFLHHYQMQTDILLPDNERVIQQSDGATLAYNRPSNAFGGARFASSLTPQYEAGAMLGDFERWQVTGTVTMLDRTCAIIETAYQDESYRLYTDVQTGILLKLEPLTNPKEFYKFLEVTALRIDEEIAVKRFEPEGKKCLNPDDADWVPTDPSYSRYPVNEYGLTYGEAGDAVRIEDYPDLIACIGDNGKKGYIYSAELFEGTQISREEAEKIAEEQHNGTYIPRILTVYKSDGKTHIDTFTEKP